jgi:hypothetical protein
MRTKKYDWNYEQIRQLYEVQGKTVEEIGVILGRSSKLVNKWCKKLGIRMRPRGQKFGPEHKGWKGGRLVDKSGYILIYLPEHPNASNAGYVREHRLVMERKLGRLLLRSEVVHHKDDDRANNDPDNLEVFATNAAHLAETLKGKCPQWTPEGRARTLAGARKPRPRKSTLDSSAPSGQM